jgi:hypothetical protein
MLDSHVSHFPMQSARHSVQRLDSAGFPRFDVPNTSFDFSNRITILHILFGFAQHTIPTGLGLSQLECRSCRELFEASEPPLRNQTPLSDHRPDSPPPDTPLCSGIDNLTINTVRVHPDRRVLKN